MKIGWLSKACEQLYAYVRRIAEDSPQAAIDLAREIRAKTDGLSTYPLRCRVGRVAGTREMVVRPNYIVVYRIAGGKILILRVRHARQKRP